MVSVYWSWTKPQLKADMYVEKEKAEEEPQQPFQLSALWVSLAGMEREALLSMWRQ